MTVMIHRGFFVMAGRPLFKLEREVDEEVANALLDCFDFFIEEYAHAHYLFGCTQISEIAVKALSPGINDPGTAITAIDMLSVLFSKRLPLPDLDIAQLDDRAAAPVPLRIVAGRVTAAGISARFATTAVAMPACWSGCYWR